MFGSVAAHTVRVVGFLNNPAAILNPAAREWFRQLLHDNTNIFEALKTPIYLVRHKLPEDTSMLVAHGPHGIPLRRSSPT